MFFLNLFLDSLQVFLFLITLYEMSIALYGFRPYKTLAPCKPGKRFAIVIPAHNEERVIGQLIQNLKSLSYPQHLYEIFVVCDNCNDRTATIARSAGAQVMERWDRSHRGKGYALAWTFRRLLEAQPQRWDAFVILDADNLVSPNFLERMNTYLQNGHLLLQACLDVKNPDDSWISRCYALCYWSTNRIYQLARYNLGWSCVLGGTGICVDARLIQSIGWQAMSLTEDLEFTLQCLLRKNVRATWVHDAKIYDEKPMTLRQSSRQRIRWMQGHASCLFRYFRTLFHQGMESKHWTKLDMCVYLIQPFVIVFSGLLLGASFWQMIHPFYQPLLSYLPNPLRLFLVLFECGIPFFGLLTEGVKWQRLFGVFYLPFFSLTWIPLAAIGIIRHRGKKWAHTEHQRVVTEDEFLQMTGLNWSEDSSAQKS